MRDGEAVEPGPRPPERPPAPSTEAEGAGQFRGYSDSSVAGWFPVDLDQVRARRNPHPLRTEFPASKPQPSNPGDLEALAQGIVAPLD